MEKRPFLLIDVMKSMKSVLLVAVVLWVLVPPACATTKYFDEPDFLAVIAPGYYLEDFTGWTYGDPLSGEPDWDAPGANGFGWHAYAPQGLWSNDSSLSTTDALDTLLITFTGNPVTAVAGVFASTDFYGNPLPQDVVVGLNDGTTVTLKTSGFAGFTSSTPFAWLSVDGVDSPSYNWPQLDHFFVGQAVPEPSGLLALAAGLPALAGLAIRRRHCA